MYNVFPCLLAAVLSLAPALVRAESGAPIPAPTFEMPFDDIDPLAAQAELTQHIARFLDKIQKHWGSSPDSLRSNVTGDLERDEHDALVVTRRFADHGVLEGYKFHGGSLIAGQYLVLQRPVNGLNEFIDYYQALKTALTATYGEPAEDRSIWSNDLYQPLPDYWGIAVQMGHLRYAARWDRPDGTITIELTGNHHSRLMIEYRSTHFIERGRTA